MAEHGSSHHCLKTSHAPCIFQMTAATPIANISLIFFLLFFNQIEPFSTDTNWQVMPKVQLITFQMPS
jgi:hypothetical protein